MSGKLEREETLFWRALQLPPSRRAAFLATQCADDPGVAEGVANLLAQHETQDTLDESMDRWLTSELGVVPADLSAEDLVGQQVGNYVIRQRVGEGGTGIVYLAWQEEPLQRQVALKCIKPGMDTREVLTRFAAERQTLAMMHHPGVAQVFDAGITERGRPYFVMEYVEGQPLDRFCDAQRLDVTARLDLFRQVCLAVEHAHQKGVIHRDLKPSNVLVESTTQGPAPKIIDFGIAKALAGSLVDDRDLTRRAEFIGTPNYMSPEQARGDPDLDTRTDIYSLGAMLHTILCGCPLVSPEMWTKGGIASLQAIKSRQPPRASARWEALPPDERENIARLRGTSAGRLGKRLREDLDWIVHRCLEPERDRRYDSVGDLAEDLRRTLVGEAVEAVAPSWSYRLRKSWGRHRIAFVATTSIVVTLVAATWVSRSQAVRALAAEREAAREAAVSGALVTFLRDDVLAQASPELQPDRELTVTQALLNAAKGIEDEFAEQPAVEAAVRRSIGDSLVSMGEFQAAQEHLRRAWQLYREHRGPRDLETLRAREGYLRSLRAQGMFAEAERVGAGFLELLQDALGAEAALTLQATEGWAVMRLKQARFDEAQALLEGVIQIREARLGPSHELTLESLGHLARSFGLRHDFAEAENRLLDLVRRQTDALGPEDLRTLKSRQALANAYNRQAKSAEALAIYQDVYEIRRRIQGPEHPDTIGLLQNMGSASSKLFKVDAALSYFERAYEALRETVGPDHPSTLMSQLTLGEALMDARRFDESTRVLAAVYEGTGRTFGPDHYRTTDAMTLVARNLGLQGRFEEAAPIFEAALASRIEHYGEESARVIFTSYVFVNMLLDQGEVDRAVPLMERTHRHSLQTNGRININTIYMAAELMRAYLLSGRPAQAVGVGEPLAAELREKYPNRHMLAVFEMRLARAYAAAGNSAAAAEMLTRAATLFEARREQIPPVDRLQIQTELDETREVVFPDH